MTLDVALHEGGRDDAWDAFVASAPGGSHVQTTLWAAVKGVIGWSGARAIVRRDGRIVAGCQLLLRTAGPATLAYGPRGPLVEDHDDGEALEATLSAVCELAGRRRLCYLKVQPPPGGEHIAQRLLGRGYSRSDLEAAPTATALVDLRDEPDDLMSRMRSGTRANIRKAARRGVTVREGGMADLDTFADVVRATSERQGFHPYPPAYYRHMLELFGDRAALLLAEHEGRVLTALLIIAWNDTVVYKMGGWSGERPAIRPNELAHWTAMQWARERGYRYYDLDGLPPGVARVLVDGGPFPEPRGGTAWFKMGFGSEARVYPGAYDTSPSPLVAPLVRRAAPRLSRGRSVALWALGRRSAD